VIGDPFILGVNYWPRRKAMTWNAFGKPRSQFMASETDYAHYPSQVLGNLQTVGSTGAMLWCFADYAEELWSSPPCNEAIHERFSGLVRPDGSLKPHAEVIRRFARTQPTVRPPALPVRLGVGQKEFYADPRRIVEQLYRDWVDHYVA
jgi:hypothetical protein